MFMRKIVTLTHQYELSTVKDGEIMDGMFRRIQVLVNGLEALGQNFSKAYINTKLLHNMLKVWKPKTITI